MILDQKFMVKNTDGTFDMMIVSSDITFPIDVSIIREVDRAYAKLAIRPEYISLNKPAYEYTTVKYGGFIREFYGCRIIYNPDQKEPFKVLFDAETQYLFGHLIDDK